MTQPPEYQPPAWPPIGRPPQPEYGQQPQYPEYGQPSHYPEPPTNVVYGQPTSPQYGPPSLPPQYGPPPAAPPYVPPPAYPPLPPPPGSAPPAGWPAPPPAPPRKRSGLVVGLVVGGIVLLVLCALGVGGAVFFLNKDRTVASENSTAPSQKPHFTGDLRTILIKPPAGTQTGKPNSASADGTVTLENAASFLYYNQSGAVNQLRSFGYSRGAMVAFGNTTYQVTSALFQFQDKGGADKTLQSIIQGYESDPTVTKKGTVPGVSNVRYVQPSQTFGAGLHVIISYYSHDDMYGSVLYYSKDVADPGALTEFVKQQLALLP